MQKQYLVLFSLKGSHTYGYLDEQGMFCEQKQLPEEPPESICVIIPGILTLLTEVNVQGAHSNEWRQVATYALEEQLAQDIDRCFFAIGVPNQADDLPVMVIDQEQFSRILKEVTELGIEPDAIIPDYWVFNVRPTEWAIWPRDDGVLAVRTGLLSGFSLEASSFLDWYDHYIDQHPDGAPEQISVLAQETVLFDRKSKHPLPKIYVRPLTLCLDASPFQLLQATYRPAHQHKTLSRFWRRWFYGGVLLLGMLLLTQVVEYAYLTHLSSRWEQRIVAYTHRLLPNEPVDRQMRVRTTRLLRYFNKRSRQNKLFKGLSALGAAMQDARVSMQLLSLQYASQTAHPILTLIVQTPKRLDIQHIVKKLSVRARGFKITQGPIYKQQSMWRVHLTIKSKV